MIKIEITEDILNVLGQIKINNINGGVDILTNDLFYTSDVLSTIMMVWGKYDNHIKDTEKSFDGRIWNNELEDKAWNTYNYIINNLNDIISIVMTNAVNGVKVGIYKRKDKEPGLWQYESFSQTQQ